MKVSDRLKRQIKEDHYKQKMIASKIGLNETTLSAKLNGHRKLYADEFRDICIALSLDANQILREAAEETKREEKSCGNMR